MFAILGPKTKCETRAKRKAKDMIRNSKSSNFPERMDRRKAVLTTFERHEQQDITELVKMPYEEKSQLITFLREAQYGTKATTGRLQRFYRIVKLK